MNISEEAKQRVEKWIKHHNLNEYGDRPGTVYPGGNPLFNERGPGLRDRYEYILTRHPHLRDEDS